MINIPKKAKNEILPKLSSMINTSSIEGKCGSMKELFIRMSAKKEKYIFWCIGYTNVAHHFI